MSVVDRDARHRDARHRSAVTRRVAARATGGLAATLLAGALAARHVAVASADQWCDVDPAVVIATPAGNLVVVFVNTGAYGLTNQPLLLLASMKWTVEPARQGTATLVRLDVTVPNGLLGVRFPTRTTASSGPLGTGTVYAQVSGMSGEPMRATFTLDVP